MLPADAKKIIVEFYDAYNSQSFEQDDLSSIDRESEFDDDKIQHIRVGRTELSIDKILQNLIVIEEYLAFRNIIFREGDDMLPTPGDGT